MLNAPTRISRLMADAADAALPPGDEARDIAGNQEAEHSVVDAAREEDAQLPPDNGGIFSPEEIEAVLQVLADAKKTARNTEWQPLGDGAKGWSVRWKARTRGQMKGDTYWQTPTGDEVRSGPDARRWMERGGVAAPRYSARDSNGPTRTGPPSGLGLRKRQEREPTHGHYPRCPSGGCFSSAGFSSARTAGGPAFDAWEYPAYDDCGGMPYDLVGDGYGWQDAPRAQLIPQEQQPPCYWLPAGQKPAVGYDFYKHRHPYLPPPAPVPRPLSAGERAQLLASAAEDAHRLANSHHAVGPSALHEALDGLYCSKCGGDDQPGNDILLCDASGCESAYHMQCLKVPLLAVPEGDWFCDKCVVKRKPKGKKPAAAAAVAAAAATVTSAASAPAPPPTQPAPTKQDGKGGDGKRGDGNGGSGAKGDGAKGGSDGGGDGGDGSGADDFDAPPRKKLPRDLAALADVNRAGPAWSPNKLEQKDTNRWDANGRSRRV